MTYVNKHCISLYLITDNDVSKLKQHNLIRIRYTISDSFEGEVNRSARNDEFTGDALRLLRLLLLKLLPKFTAII